jgi:2,3-bisphosphoglycerate-independent phosphoglycerate mutase
LKVVHRSQVWGLLGGAVERGAKKVRLHILTDGRDVADGTSSEYVEKLEQYLAELNSKGADVKIASGGGRMAVTMDRYEVRSRWQKCDVPVCRM